MKRNIFTSYHPVETALPCNDQLLSTKHCVFPGLNVCNQEISDIDDFLENVNLYSHPMMDVHRPLPCLSPKFSHSSANTTEDHVVKLIRDKHRWKRKKDQLIQLIKSKPHMRKKVHDSTAENMKLLSYGMVLLASHLANKPDKYFKGFYNWYYGNSMTTTVFNNEEHLLHAGGDNSNKLIISSFTTEDNTNVTPVLSPKISVLFPDADPIYDIIASKISGLVGVRQRNRCSFLVYENDNNVTRSIAAEKNNSPFVCMDVNDAEFCSINANREVNFWNPLFSKRCIQSAKLPEPKSYLADNFVQIKFDVNTNSQTYVAVDRGEIYLFDKRLSYCQPCSYWTPQPYVELCENISLLIPSIAENHWYIGLTHSCLLLDIRVGFIQKWSHMLPQTPAVGQSFKINSSSRQNPRESLILSTQTTNDIVAIYNTWSSDKVVQSCTPTALPDRIDTLHDARMNGIFSYPGLKKKFDYSVIGLSTYKCKKNLGIFSLISTGDIFHQSVKKRNKLFSSKNQPFSQNELNYLEKWEFHFKNNCLKNENHLVTTGVADMSDLLNDINDVSVENLPEWIPSKTDNESQWKRSKNCLESYTDILAPILLHGFETDDMSEWDSEEENKTKQSVLSSFGKVENWLLKVDNNFGTTNFDETDTMIPEYSGSVFSRDREVSNIDTESGGRVSTTSILSLELSASSVSTRSLTK